MRVKSAVSRTVRSSGRPRSYWASLASPSTPPEGHLDRRRIRDSGRHLRELARIGNGSALFCRRDGVRVQIGGPAELRLAEAERLSHRLEYVSLIVLFEM